MADTEQKQQTPYTPPSHVNPDDLMKAFQEEGIVEKPPAPQAAPAEPKPAEPPPPAAEPESLLEKARKKAEERRAKEAQRPQVEALSVFSPQEMERIAQARRSGDPVAALAALGFSHAQYSAKLAGVPTEPKTEEVPVPPVVETLKQEIERLKQEREAEKFQAARSEGLRNMQAHLAKDERFSHLNALGSYEMVEQEIIGFIQKYGSPPGDTFHESVEIAAEAVEKAIRNGDVPLTKKQWEKVQSHLTPAPASAPLEPQKAPESQPSTGTVTPRTLTNSNTTAPAAVRTVPKTRAEIEAAIIEGRDLDLA